MTAPSTIELQLLRVLWAAVRHLPQNRWARLGAHPHERIVRAFGVIWGVSLEEAPYYVYYEAMDRLVAARLIREVSRTGKYVITAEGVSVLSDGNADVARELAEIHARDESTKIEPKGEARTSADSTRPHQGAAESPACPAPETPKTSIPRS